MGRLTQRAAPELGHAETGEACFGFGAAPGGAFVADFPARPCGGPGVRRNGGRVVVGFHLHQDMLHTLALVVARHEAREGCAEGFDPMPFHHGGVVGISHHSVLRIELVGVADHAKQAVALRLAIDDEVGIENFVAAVLAVGLRKHHQLGVTRVAIELFESLQQVVDLIVSQRQAPVRVRLRQG